MDILELFAGSRSIGKVAKKRGHNVCSVDIEPFDGIDIVADISHLRSYDLPFRPDMIWASPPCTTYSIAAISHHRHEESHGTLRTITPKTELAKKSDYLIINVIKLISDFGCLFYMENPMGMLRKMYFMRGLERTTVTYCSYGDIRMKPTDIWSNNIFGVFNVYGWNPKPMCFNGNTKCHHEPAPRGSKTGTQGLKGDYERSKIPEQLCEEIIIATEKRLKDDVMAGYEMSNNYITNKF